jgi:hypothetical protein
MDSDYVLVMHDGKACLNSNTPAKLLQNEYGMFKKLVAAWEKEHSLS